MKGKYQVLSIIIMLTTTILLTSCIDASFTPKTNKNDNKPQTNNSTEKKTDTPTKNDNNSNETGKSGNGINLIKIPGNFNRKTIVKTGLSNNLKILGINRNKLGSIGRLLPGGQKNTSPSMFALGIKDKNMPVLQHMGHGYDVFDNYASAKYIKQGQILNLDKLLADGKIYRKDMPESVYKEVTSENARSYSSSVATSVSLSGSYLFFSGSVKTNFSNEHLEQGNNFFSTIFYNIGLYELYIDPGVDLTKYIKPEELNVLETKDANYIFSNYGTHVLRSLQAGGRFDYNTSISEKYVKDINSFSSNVKASFNALFSSANAKVDTSSTEVSEEFNKNSEVRIFTYGGDGVDGQSIKADASTLKTWMTSVQGKPSVSDFGSNAFVPIWDLCKTKARKEYLKKEFEKYAASKLTIVPSEMAINGLRLNFVSKTDSILNQFEDESGVWYYVSNIASHSDRPGDGFALLYCRYGRIDDSDNPPIQEVIFENATQGEDALSYFNQKYGSDPSAELYGWNGTKNIEGSNLGNAINQTGAVMAGAHEVRLYYVTSKKGKPIKSLIVRHINNRGETVYFPYAPDAGKNYESIIDKTSKMEGKIIPQNVGEGAKTPLREKFMLYQVYGNVYLEFSRE